MAVVSAHPARRPRRAGKPSTPHLPIAPSLIAMLELLVSPMAGVVFIHSWNNVLFALMFINDQEKFTVPLGLSCNLGALAAAGVVAALPVVIVFAFIQRYLVQGMSSGAVKG
ncbi:hypothetical protein AB0C18_09235 [Nonomuraea muscovyensis]|uniref:hypothetical protein n=1 Tax=Nonomuraea muscovyensis TaxID=1124761 RepID=UPI0033D1663E